MAVKAPFHLQRRLLDHQRHAIDAAVARFTADALPDVDAVIEVNEVRQIVHAHPVERLVVAEAGAHRLEIRAGVPDLRVTVDARLGRRDAGRRRDLNRGMAIATLDADAAGVVLVAELDRLFDELISVGDEIGPLQREDDPAEAEDQENDRNQAGFRPGVGDFRNTCDMRSCGPAVLRDGPQLSRFLRCQTCTLPGNGAKSPCEKFLNLILCGTAVQKQLGYFPEHFSPTTRLDGSTSDVIIHPADAKAASNNSCAAGRSGWRRAPPGAGMTDVDVRVGQRMEIVGGIARLVENGEVIRELQIQELPKPSSSGSSITSGAYTTPSKKTNTSPSTPGIFRSWPR